MKKIYPLMLLSVVMSMTACTNAKPKLAFNIDINLNAITEEFDTHTKIQETYLEDDYENIDKYGKGTKEQSKPNTLDLTWNLANFDVNLTGLRLEISEDDKMSNPKSIMLSSDATKATVDNFKVGTTYYWTITAISDEKEVTSEPSSFSTKDDLVRFINIDGASNVRDIGGWTGLDGKKIKQGLLYRGNEWNQQNYKGYSKDDETERAKDKPYGMSITQKGIDTVVNDLKIISEVDVRGYETFDWETNKNERPTECGGLTNGHGLIDEVKYVINPVHTSRDKIYYDSYGKAAVKNFFTMLAEKENYLPMYFHCSQGKDRTGFIAYLFEAFLGVSDEDMMRDYLLSNLGNINGSVSISKLVGSNANYNYVDYLDGKLVSTKDIKDDAGKTISYKAEGDTQAERAYNYLLECGLSEEQLDTIRDTFLEE